MPLSIQKAIIDHPQLPWKKTCCCMEHYHIWVFPKIGGKTPKWMVKIMETLIKMDDLGAKPTIWGNTHIWNMSLKPWIHSEEKSSIRFFFNKGKPAFFVTFTGSSTGVLRCEFGRAQRYKLTNLEHSLCCYFLEKLEPSKTKQCSCLPNKNVFSCFRTSHGPGLKMYFLLWTMLAYQRVHPRNWT